MHDVFISYSREDSDSAELIANRLQQEGLSIFFDRDSLVAGESFSERIAEELEQARAVVVLLSGRSKRNRWVEQELTHALEGNKLVVPVLLDAAATDNWVWPLVSNRMAVKLDASGTKFELEIAKLARDVQQAIGRPMPPPPPPAFMKPHVSPWWIAAIAAIASAAVSGVVAWWLTR